MQHPQNTLLHKVIKSFNLCVHLWKSTSLTLPKWPGNLYTSFWLSTSQTCTFLMKKNKMNINDPKIVFHLSELPAAAMPPSGLQAQWSRFFSKLCVWPVKTFLNNFYISKYILWPVKTFSSSCNIAKYIKMTKNLETSLPSAEWADVKDANSAVHRVGQNIRSVWT